MKKTATIFFISVFLLCTSLLLQLCTEDRIQIIKDPKTNDVSFLKKRIKYT